MENQAVVTLTPEKLISTTGGYMVQLEKFGGAGGISWIGDSQDFFNLLHQLKP